MNDIQSLVLYNRVSTLYRDRALGLGIELYNETNDPELIKPLAITNEISIGGDFYRFDFPSFDTYTLGTTTGVSTTQITSNAEIDDAILTTFDTEINISSDLLNITGDLVVGDVNIITELGTKQPTIDTNTDLSSKTLRTTGNIISPSFRVYIM